MASPQQAVWNDGTHSRRYWRQLDEFLFIVTELRAQTSLEQARQLALRLDLVGKFVGLCQAHGFVIDRQQQVALMRLSPMVLLVQCLSWRQSPFTATPLPLMGRDELDQQLTELVTSLGDGKAMVNWLSFRGHLYTNGLIAAYEAKQQGDAQAALLNTGDLSLCCPGFQWSPVRDRTKKQNITAASSALAGLMALGPAKTDDVPQALGRLSDRCDYRGYCKLLIASQQPASFLHRLARGGLKSILSLNFSALMPRKPEPVHADEAELVPQIATPVCVR